VDAPATLVWIAPDPPEAAQTKALAGWAAAHDVKLVAPAPWAPIPLRVDDHVASEVEDLLDRVRDALAADDGRDVDATLARADALLRAHPELPQAAWLMAEVERGRALRWSRIRPTDAEAAARSWKLADALDGGRLASLGEQGLDGHAAPASVDLAARLDPNERAWIDGRPAAGRIETAAGLHAAVVTWGGDPVWAQWREVPAGASTLAIDPPLAAPCSDADVAPVRFEGRLVEAGAVRCPSWVAARPDPATPRGVELASCSESSCGPLVEWRLAEPWVAPAPAAAPRSTPWPAWATWSVVGVGAAVAAGTAAALANALRTPAPETRFVTGGIQRE
jgi:hypothetical protein